MPNSAAHVASVSALPLPPTDVTDGTDTTAQLTLGTSTYGHLGFADYDFYKIRLEAGHSYDFRLLGVGREPVTDPKLTICDFDYTTYAASEDAFGAFGYNSVVSFTPTTSGFFYVEAEGFAKKGDFLITVVETTVGGAVLTADEVAWQLTNNFERYFETSLFSNVAATAYDLPAERSLTYNISQLTAAGQTLAVQAMQMWSDIAGITFTATSGAAQLTFDDSDTDASAYNNNVTLKNGTITSSSLMISDAWLREFGTTLNSYSFETSIHEIGHALGLGHGGNYNGWAEFGTDNYYLNDSQHLSIMSYMQSDNDEFSQNSTGFNTFVNAQFRWVLTPMIADIVAIGNLYGLSTTTRTGNTTYGYNANTGNVALDTAVRLNDPVHDNYVAFTIFDNGGSDTVDMSGYAGAQRIDLQQGASSDVLGGRLNMGIAYGSVVENAYGGSGDDRVIGNAADNLLHGAGGADVLDGGSGNDTLDGDGGRDTLAGGIGDDRYFTSDGDIITEALNAGTDKVYSSASYVLAANLENLSLIGSAAINGSGNALANLIIGNTANNSLYGGSGADSLLGGLGSDKLNGEAFDAGFDPAAAQVYRLYQAVLDRAPDPVGLNNWTNRIASGATSLQQAANSFVTSVEFQKTYGATSNETFVTLLYDHVLHRTPDSNGFAAWTVALNTGRLSRAAVVTGFSESAEFGRNTAPEALGFSRAGLQADWADDVYRLYRATLDRAPDVAGLTTWTTTLAQGRGLLSVVEGFTASREFIARYGATSDSDFVTLLYRNVLDRDPDARGLATWMGHLENATLTRAEVVRGFANSVEFVRATGSDLATFMRQQMRDDQLVADAGDDLLFGGLGADSFVFDVAATGHHRVADLEAWDRIDLQCFGYSNTIQIREHLTQVGDDVVFADRGVIVTFVDTALNAISDAVLGV